jgi:hypothetical protein
MPQVTGFNVIEATAGDVYIAGAPTAGTDEVHTITIGGTPTGGTFALSLLGFQSAPITWSATNATLIANIDAALEAMPVIGTGGVVTAAGTLTAGIGTITLTFGGNLTKLALGSVTTVADNSLTGTAPTVAVAQTTPGVTATRRGALVGAKISSDNGKAYINTGTALAPTWTVIGTQT